MSLIEERRSLITWAVFAACLALVVGCDDASSPGDPGTSVDGGAASPGSFLALVRGTPFTGDLTMVQAAHDPIGDGRCGRMGACQR